MRKTDGARVVYLSSQSPRRLGRGQADVKAKARFRGMNSGVQWVDKQQTPDHQRGRGSFWDAPLAHRRPGYPSSGCSPAEPDSVSPGAATVTEAIGAGKAR
jgi:hypothetical protein